MLIDQFVTAVQESGKEDKLGLMSLADQEILLKNGSKIQVLAYVDRGGYGVIYKVLFNGKTRALKSMLRKHEFFRLEIAFLGANRYPFTSRLYFSHQDQLFITEFYSPVEAMDNAGNLWEYISSGPYRGQLSMSKKEKIASMVYLQITTMFYYMHRHGFLVNDFKSDNVVIADDGMIHMIDFGLIECIYANKDPKFKKLVEESICKEPEDPSFKKCPKKKTSSQAGTLTHFSPRIAEEECHDFHEDFWCLATTLYSVLTSSNLIEDGEIDEDIIAHYKEDDYFYLKTQTLLAPESKGYGYINTLFHNVMEKTTLSFHAFYMKNVKAFDTTLNADAYAELLDCIDDVDRDGYVLAAKRIRNLWKRCWKAGKEDFEIFCNFRTCQFLTKGGGGGGTKKRNKIRKAHRNPTNSRGSRGQRP